MAHIWASSTGSGQALTTARTLGVFRVDATGNVAAIQDSDPAAA
ncbi:hypothetical protein SAMN04489832_6724 [Micromonospora cremea]|uniref:Uncharacterized protein n=1 Tax=Micromonospora cremea TaxID=709881 RepID=A0A1N6B5W7_9ACTN|nr:hypothetical protein SAMN04489832_6724 [Micromonospora cremea]